VDPAGQSDSLPGVFGPEGVAMVRAFHAVKSACSGFCPATSRGRMLAGNSGEFNPNSRVDLTEANEGNEGGSCFQ
jgi:hypothetical protein